MISIVRPEGEKESDRQTDRERDRDRKGSHTAESGRCRGRKRDLEHLSALLPAEECLPPQDAQYETRSQLQLMVKGGICLDYIAVKFLPQRLRQKQGQNYFTVCLTRAHASQRIYLYSTGHLVKLPDIEP